jgi:hypothetical protein
LPNIDSRAAEQIRPELYSDEIIYWAAMPDPHVTFHSDDWTLIPFSLAWCGFMMFWEASALGFWQNSRRSGSPDVFAIVWGIPFVVMGNYMVWGRFLHDAWLKHRTYYAATNRRFLIVQDTVFHERNTGMIFLEAIPCMNREGTSRGTIWFGEKYPVLGSRGSKKRDMSRFSLNEPLAVADIDDVALVERLISDLRAKVERPTTNSPILTYPDTDRRR